MLDGLLPHIATLDMRTDNKGEDMNSITQHLPAYVEGFENVTVEFNDDDSLVSIPFVRRFSELKDFSHFAVSDNCLMAIYKDGFEWWVVGYIKEPWRLKLRKWDGAKYHALLDGKEVVLGKEVKYSCGNKLILYDGRVAENLR
jgi:hypothetical protein